MRRGRPKIKFTPGPNNELWSYPAEAVNLAQMGIHQQIEAAARARLPAPSTSLFHLVLIKPTHYDDDGYPIQWFRSAIPSNTLACLYGLA